MHLARMRYETPDGPQPRIVASHDPAGGWVDVRTHERLRLQRAGATPEAAARIAAATVPGSMSAALAGGDAFADAAAAALADTSGDARVDPAGRLTNALDPLAYRDFMCFAEHFSFGYRWQQRPVPEIMYELPVSYFGNPRAFIGPDDEVPWPHYTRRMDYELELGIVIGRPCTNVTPEEALDYVAGLTILNDFSARDIQAREMTGGLGPAKGKHFACGAGPYLVSLDALPWQDGLRMQARVNGETWCDATSAEMIWTIAEIVAWTSQGEQLQPGWLLGSGTCNGGSTIEIGRDLHPGDVVELEIEGLGVLRNRLGQPREGGWWPQPRRPAEAA
jgi:2-keto-4-pentenoate hydratase/2-oxohepta-3-ene-1,7-dioic acid hydratase in catechol pathway